MVDTIKILIIGLRDRDESSVENKLIKNFESSESDINVEIEYRSSSKNQRRSTVNLLKEKDYHLVVQMTKWSSHVIHESIKGSNKENHICCNGGVSSLVRILTNFLRSKTCS